MNHLNFSLPTHISFGPGIINRLAKKVRGLGKKVMIVIGQGSVKKHGYLDNVLAQLKSINVEAIVFEGIEPNPRAETIDRAAAFARLEKPRYVIAIGGGSVMDAAKCIAMLAVSPGQIWDYVYKGISGDMKRIQKSLPIVTIPTLAGTGSEADSYAVVTNSLTKEKCTVFGDAFYPTLAIVDPELTCSVPLQPTIDGAIDIIAHALEEYLSTEGEPTLQDRFSIAIVSAVVEALPKVLANPNDIEARSQLSWASTMALSGILSGRDGGWPMHAIEHAISAHTDVSHGRGLAAILPVIMQFDLGANAEKIAILGEQLFHEKILLTCRDAKSCVSTDGGNTLNIESRAQQTIDCFTDWLKSVGAWCTISDFNLTEIKKQQIVEDIIRLNGDSRGVLENIRPLTENDLQEILG